MKVLMCILFMLVFGSNYGQVDTSLIANSDREKAFLELLDLRNDGALVFRVILNKKSADLYRKAGKIKIADRIEKKQNRRNRLLAKAFLDSTFNYCPVYIIESKDYGKAINGVKSGYFLNSDLKLDTSITLNEKNIFFLDIGNVYETVREVNDFKNSEVTSTPIVQDALVIKDKNLNQLMKPFPFYIPVSGFEIDLVDLIDYYVGKNQKIANTNGLQSHASYLRKKYKVNNQDSYLMGRPYILNIRLHSYYPRAYNYKKSGGFEK